MGSVHLPQFSGWKYPQKIFEINQHLACDGVKLSCLGPFFLLYQTCRFWEFEKVTHPVSLPRLLVDGNGKKYQMHLTSQKKSGGQNVDG